MIASFQAELMKLWRRPAVWVLGGILVAAIVALGYVVSWLVVSHIPAGSDLARTVRDPASLKLAYYPVNWVKNTLGIGGELGGAMCMVLGVLVVGSEYGWGTFKTVLTQTPARLATFGGRLGAVALVIGIYELAIFLATAVTSVVIALIDNHSITWPAAGTVIAALAAEWLVFATWTAFGMLLAFLFRQSGLAVGIGLVYMLILEGLVLSLLSQVGGQWILELRKLLPGTAASALADSFGQSGSALATRAAAQALIGAQRATITLGVYVVAFCAIAAIVFRRRDVME